MNDRSLGGMPITGWLAIVLAMIGVLIWKQVPLDPDRTAATDVPQTELRALQDVNARLWEDPFTAVARAKADLTDIAKAERDSSHSIETVCRQLLAGSADAEFHLQVIAAMVSNAPYADGDESRRRVRYATLSALNLAHFVPENADHLGYFRWNGMTDVPFETFRRKNTGRGKAFYALVLWLEDEVVSWTEMNNASAQSLDGQPIRRLAMLRDQVRRSCKPGATTAKPGRFVFSVLGPASSQTLRTMTRELQAESRKPQAARRGFGDGFDLYSPFATAPAKEIMGSHKSEAAARACAGAHDEWYCRLGQLFAEHGIGFHRVIGTDNAAAHALVDELERRGVDIRSAAETADSRHHVAIVSEWDTYYGRRLPVVFLRAAGLESACETDPSEGDADDSAAGRECRVVRFSYLRGLDGQGPRGAAATRSGKEGQDQAMPRGTFTEPAEGVSQFDYLRRLAARIERENDRLKRSHRGEIGAIGVLGSDVYDKIAVLRALRPAFPRAVFFTTDLDARLLRARHLEWTRNVVVASGFGFDLAPCLQKGVPPFRSTYQTAAFLGTQIALFNAMPVGSPFRGALCPDFASGEAPGPTPSAGAGGAAPPAAGPVTPGQLDDWLATPRLFELGRTGAVSLDGATPRCGSLAACSGIHPDERDVEDGVEKFLWGCAGAGVFFALLLLVNATRPIVTRPFNLAIAHLGQGTTAERAGVLLVLAAVVGPPIWVILRALASIRDPGGEPFFWAEGVSVWPSELIRLVALVLGVCFLVYLFSEVSRSAERVAKRFDLRGGRDNRSLWRVMAGWFSTGEEIGAKGRAAHLWAQYCQSGHLFWRLLRSFAWVMLFSAGAAVLFHLTGYPNNPARGVAAMQVEDALRTAVVFVFLLLLFAVNDAIRLCTRFLRELTASRETNDWSPAACAEFAEALGLPATLQPAARDRMLDAWIDTRFAARFTADIGPLLYFPFVIFALLIAARWHGFDGWDLAPGLVVVLAASFVLACVNAIEMQRAASQARYAARWRLNDMVIRASGGADKDYPSVQSLQTLVKMIESLREGAFVPFVEQPLVRAALIPFSSAGGLYLVELFSLAN